MKMNRLLILLAVIALAACSKLTMENYDKLKIGMPYEEVVNIIGSPDKCSDVMGVKNCQWGNEKRSVNVTFAGNKVLFLTSNGLK
jgi:hypothetical protein